MAKDSSTVKYYALTYILTMVIFSPVSAQREPIPKETAATLSTSAATYCLATHDIGRLVFGITNFGRIGLGRARGPNVDCYTGIRPPQGEYPKGSNSVHLYKGALWVGGIFGRDTLVSTGAYINSASREWHPITDMKKLSILDPDSPFSQDAVSEQDYIAVYTDTFTQGVPYLSFDAIERRPHKPLNLEVTQKSHAWSYSHTDDIVLIEYSLRNVSSKPINDIYVGIYLDADVHSASKLGAPEPNGGKPTTHGSDDLSGFLFRWKTQTRGCSFFDTVLIAWTADNNGDPLPNGTFDVPNVIGIRFLGSVTSQRDVSFNWWTTNYNSTWDFGPQMKKNFRFMGNGTGTPYGDRHKYAMMSNGEIDYDQAYAWTIGESNSIWVSPYWQMARRATTGIDVQHLLSVGPYQMGPGGSMTIPMAIVGGEGFHTDRSNFSRNLRGKYQPDIYYQNVDFSSLASNALVVDRVYDIPGFDTDGDGYRGKFRVCILDSSFVDSQWVTLVADTIYYKGDGIPDMKAAEPPPAPDFWIYPIHGGLRIRLNGARSETTPDIFSRMIDFEGYRIYIARDDRETSYSLAAQYDLPNFDKYVYTKRGKISYFTVFDDPFTLEELRCLYGQGLDRCADSSFDPFFFIPERPYTHPLWPDSIFYFNSHDYNRSVLGINTPIRKIYPDVPKPPSPEDVKPEHLTKDGFPKYYEYEFLIEDLLPNVPYYIAVTAFDFGSPSTGLEPLESSKTLTARFAYPDNDLDLELDEIGNVYVFPNPYRNDAGYRINGFEGRGQDHRSRDRVRKITFANLPPKCTIKIFSLDGDLIRELKHNFSPSDPNSSYHDWDLVTRNIQMVVSGLYYWVVEDSNGRTQIGKLAILL